jgi:TolB protein
MFAFRPAWSPEGTQIAFAGGEDGNGEIFVIDLTTGEIANVSQHTARDTHPSWAPDGNHITFVSNRDGNQEIYVLDLISGESWNVSNNPAADFWPSWSPALK